jgi:hypothetical protein
VLRQPYIVVVDPLNDNVRSQQFDIGYANSQTVDTGFDAAWVLSGRFVFKMHPGTGEGETFLTLPSPTGLVTWSIALGDAIWVAESDGTLIHSDPLTGARDQSETGLDVDVLALASRSLWASDILQAAVFEIDRETMMPTGRSIRIGGSIDLLTGRGDHLWALDRRLGAVTRVNASTGVVSSAARVGDEPTGMAVASDAVWVGDLGGSLYRIDPETLEVERFDIGSEVLGVAADPADDDSVWLYLGREIE